VRNIAKYASLFVVMAALSFGSQARETVPIIEHNDIPVITGSGKPITAEQVRNAITAAAASHKWDVRKSSSPDVLTATLVVRGKHTVVASIPYSTEKFSIRYQSSINMKYELADPAPTGSIDLAKLNAPTKDIRPGTPMIHPFYNKWVQDLLQAIQVDLKRL
jgi:hypothetical protein